MNVISHFRVILLLVRFTTKIDLSEHKCHRNVSMFIIVCFFNSILCDCAILPVLVSSCICNERRDLDEML